MGDRGNIAVLHSDKDQIWLYSHWGGTELPEKLQTALGKAKETKRFKDPSFLTQLLHAEVKPDGLSCRIDDNEHDIMVLDIPGQRVFRITGADLKNGQIPPGYTPPESWTFDDFIALAYVET